jgi:hypothetical protein
MRHPRIKRPIRRGYHSSTLRRHSGLPHLRRPHQYRPWPPRRRPAEFRRLKLGQLRPLRRLELRQPSRPHFGVLAHGLNGLGVGSPSSVRSLTSAVRGMRHPAARPPDNSASIKTIAGRRIMKSSTRRYMPSPLAEPPPVLSEWAGSGSGTAAYWSNVEIKLPAQKKSPVYRDRVTSVVCPSQNGYPKEQWKKVTPSPSA